MASPDGQYSPDRMDLPAKTNWQDAPSAIAPFIFFRAGAKDREQMALQERIAAFE
ncbi:hypothetical protein [Rhizobium brockwellii]